LRDAAGALPPVSFTRTRVQHGPKSLLRFAISSFTGICWLPATLLRSTVPCRMHAYGTFFTSNWPHPP